MVETMVLSLASLRWQFFNEKNHCHRWCFKQEMAGLFFQGLLRDHGGLHNPKTNALFLAGWCYDTPKPIAHLLGAFNRESGHPERS